MTIAPAEARTWTLPDMVGTRLTSNHRPHWATRAKVTKEWRQLAAAQARAARVPPLRRARIVVCWIPPTRARHDAENAQPMAKACVDGLVDAGVIPDDSSEFLDGPVMRVGLVVSVGRHLRGTAALRVTITELPAAGAGPP